MNTPSDEYDTYREYRVANTNMYSRIHFFSDAKLGNWLNVLGYIIICTVFDILLGNLGKYLQN